MTAQEMSDRFVAIISADPKRVSVFRFAGKAGGAAAKGDLAIELRHNLVLWSGVPVCVVLASPLPARIFHGGGRA